MKTDHDAVLLARNKTKKRTNYFQYEGILNIMRSTGLSASEFAFGSSVLAVEKMVGKKLPYITHKDRLILNKLRVCISHNSVTLCASLLIL